MTVTTLCSAYVKNQLSIYNLILNACRCIRHIVLLDVTRYGFRGRDVKQNLVILPNTGELVYFVAAIIVLYDRKTHTQKHYTSHTEEVTW